MAIVAVVVITCTSAIAVVIEHFLASEICTFEIVVIICINSFNAHEMHKTYCMALNLIRKILTFIYAIGCNGMQRKMINGNDHVK